MKITKSQIIQIIMEELDSITGRDIPNEEKYPEIITAFEDILDSSLGDKYNFYRELQNIAEFYAKNPK
jgi:hypothetical protein